MNNKNSIGIHVVGLDVKERAIFDRVIAFNVTHGLVSHNCDDAQSSDLIISSEENFYEFEQKLENQKVLVVSNDAACNFGDVQIKRPILITRVMKSLEAAIDLVKLVKDQESEAETVDVIDADIVNGSENNDDIEKIESTTEPETTVATTEDTNAKHTGHHALIIDDSAAIRKQLELELRDAGITSDFAESGEEALEKIEDKQFDLVFLDIIMPGIDGYETCRGMRAKASYKRTPIIMLSGKTSPLDEVQGVIAGATTYLTKPVKSAMLQETLKRVTKWLDNFAAVDKTKNSETV
jgi:CheY-like chemotaxis protein